MQWKWSESKKHGEFLWEMQRFWFVEFYVKFVTIYSFQVRVEQVLVSEPGAVQLYKLANLVKFYQSTVG